MKCLDIDPIDEILLSSISLNQTSRNDDLINFIKILLETKGPFTYIIDELWEDENYFFLLNPPN